MPQYWPDVTYARTLSQFSTDKFQLSIAVIQTKYYIFYLYFLIEHNHTLLLVKREANKTIFF